MIGVLGNRMKKAALTFASALTGGVACAAFIWLAQATDVSPRFPSDGGEDDFSLRFLYFMFGVCPAFLLLGGWIGLASIGTLRRWIAMWGGATTGTVIAFVGTRILQDRLDSLSGKFSTTHLVITFYVVWVFLSIVGAASIAGLLRSLPPMHARCARKD